MRGCFVVDMHVMFGGVARMLGASLGIGVVLWNSRSAFPVIVGWGGGPY